MDKEIASQVLTRSLGYSNECAARVIRSVNRYISSNKGEGETIERYPLSWLPGLLRQAGEIGNQRFQELLASNFAGCIDSMATDEELTRAFGPKLPKVSVDSL